MQNSHKVSKIDINILLDIITDLLELSEIIPSIKHVLTRTGVQKHVLLNM